MEKKSGPLCWIRTGIAHLAVASATAASAGSGKDDVLQVCLFTWPSTMAMTASMLT
ncbi:Hypothetical predicted protein [Podarcis lilfordi]|uniref:Uncharacterized protein n=1 Tax=Podarcis lilfordi TaxID=74358 RepID=A0AA35LCZ9_9SAUR|nr:Hypothetical predicted protein [Podarcis lilfordi]